LRCDLSWHGSGIRRSDVGTRAGRTSSCSSRGQRRVQSVGASSDEIVEKILIPRFLFARSPVSLSAMENQRAAVARKLSDPDFQASLVNKSLGLVMGLSVLLTAFVIHDAYIWANPPTPKYFIVDGEHAPRPVAPLDSPIVSDAQLLDWTVKWASAPYNVNYHDYPEELNTAGRHFTLNGWRTFAESYIKSGNYEAMKQGLMLCFAQALRAAVIVDTKLISGALAYRIQFPIVQTCQNTQQANTQKMILTALVVRTNDEDHRDGIAIDQLVAEAR